MKCSVSVLILFSLTLLAFDWVADGAKWHYYENGFNSARVIVIEKGNDTTVANKNVVALNETHYVWSWHQQTHPIKSVTIPTYFTYSSGDTVFFYENGEFKWFYHFGLQVGDTVRFDYILGCGCDSSTCVVDSIGTTVINGDSLKWISMSPTAYGGYGFSGKIIERIGPVGQNFFYPSYWYCPELMGCIPELPSYTFRCYSDNSFPAYNETSQDCDFDIRVSTENILENSRVVISPNPVNSVLYTSIEGIWEENFSIDLFSIQGSKVLSTSIKNETALDLSNLPTGTYFLSVSVDDIVYRKKILKL